MTMLRQLSDRNQRTRTLDSQHVTFACLLLLLIICFGLLYEAKPSSLKNRHRKISLFGRKELPLRVVGHASRNEMIEEKEKRVEGKRGEFNKLHDSKVDEKDREVEDYERDVASDGEIEEELEEMADLIGEEEELEEKEDVERERDVMGKKIDRPSNAMEEGASTEGEKSSL